MTFSTCTIPIEQILKDMGCDKETTEEFLTMAKCGNTNGALRLLEEHRKNLLAAVHEYEKKISCLDYFTYNLKKEGLKVD